MSAFEHTFIAPRIVSCHNRLQVSVVVNSKYTGYCVLGCGCRTNAELTMELKRSEMRRTEAEHEVNRLNVALDRQLLQCKQIQV